MLKDLGTPGKRDVLGLLLTSSDLSNGVLVLTQKNRGVK